MPPKSALSAALGGGAPIEIPKPIPTAKKPFLDPAAFPFLSYAAEMDGETPDSQPSGEPAGEDVFIVEPFELVGSAPTVAHGSLSMASITFCMCTFPRR